MAGRTDFPGAKSRSIFPLAGVMLAAVLLLGSGCARLEAPDQKLPYRVYNPEGTVAAGGDYVIGARDELEILVWKCPELNREVTVRPADGYITVPLVGDIKAAGLTPKELATDISRKIAYYVKQPRVAVGVKTFGEKKVFILGEVYGRGAYFLDRGDRMIDLISRAGGFRDTAVPSSTYVIRGGYDTPEIVRVNMGRLLFEGDVSQNIYLEEGDIVYVPEQGIDNWNTALRKIFPSLYFLERMGNLQQSILDDELDWSKVFRNKRPFWK